MKIVLALSDGVAYQIYGVRVVHSQNHRRNLAKMAKIGKKCLNVGSEFPNRWTQIPGPGPKMADTRIKPGPGPIRVQW